MDGPQVIIKLIPRSSRGSSCRNMFCLSFYHVCPLPLPRSPPSSSRRYIRSRCAPRSSLSHISPSLSLSLSFAASRSRAVRATEYIYTPPRRAAAHVCLLKRFHPDEKRAFAIRFTSRIPFIVREKRRREGASKHVHMPAE